jgi:hypothetical protein
MIQDKKTTDLTTFIDVNSKQLRDVLVTVLAEIKGINLREDKLSVQYILHLNLKAKTDPT